MPSEQNDETPGESNVPPAGEGQEAASPQPAAAGHEAAPAASQDPGAQPVDGSGTVPPTPAAPSASEPGRARRWAGSKPLQLVAAGLVGAVVGGGAVAAAGAVTGDDHRRPTVSRYGWDGPGAEGRRGEGPRWHGRGGPMWCVAPGEGGQDGGHRGPIMCMPPGEDDN